MRNSLTLIALLTWSALELSMTSEEEFKSFIDWLHIEPTFNHNYSYETGIIKDE